MAGLSAVLLAAALVVPQNYDTRHFDVMEIENSAGCAIESFWELEGRSSTYLEIHLLLDGGVYFIVSSYGWSRPPSDTVKIIGLSFASPGEESRIFSMAGVPESRSLRSGLIADVPADNRDEFLDAFAEATVLRVLTADVPDEGEEYDFDLILEAGLQSSSQALANARRCLADVTRREEARRAREAQVEHIAKDPFAD